jgi:hypothetical protein
VTSIQMNDFWGWGTWQWLRVVVFRTDVGESTKYNSESNISLLDYIFGLFLYDVCGLLSRVVECSKEILACSTE